MTGPAATWWAEGIASRSANTLDAHIWSSTAIRRATGSKDAVSAKGSSVSSQATTSTSRAASGLASAAGTSKPGTTMRG